MKKAGNGGFPVIGCRKRKLLSGVLGIYKRKDIMTGAKGKEGMDGQVSD